MDIVSRAQSAMQKAGLKNTRQRRDVIRVLVSHAHAPTAAELCKELPHLPRSSVYRTLEALELAGIVESHTVQWRRRYEIVSPLAKHHHHATCIRCGAITTIEHTDLRDMLRDIGTRYGFEIKSHQFDMEVICRSCRTK
jgi:Fur family ferric uptake transcriptional regulator